MIPDDVSDQGAGATGPHEPHPQGSPRRGHNPAEEELQRVCDCAERDDEVGDDRVSLDLGLAMMR